MAKKPHVDEEGAMHVHCPSCDADFKIILPNIEETIRKVMASEAAKKKRGLRK